MQRQSRWGWLRLAGAGPVGSAVTTNSCYPLDLNLYQTVKGMFAAALVVRDGGTIICAAECSDGVPDHGDYGEMLASRDGPEALLEMISAPGHARHDQWKVRLQAQILMRAEVYLKSSFLTPDQVRVAHLKPAEDLQAKIWECIERHGEDAIVCVLPQGPQTIPYVKKGEALGYCSAVAAGSGALPSSMQREQT